MALCLAFALFSCTNEVSDNNVVGVGYQFPETTGFSNAFYSQVYNERGEKQFTVVTFNLQGWEDIPFIRLEDVGKFMGLLTTEAIIIIFRKAENPFISASIIKMTRELCILLNGRTTRFILT